MARKPFTTTIEEELQNKFKAACASDGQQMNNVLEVFMKAYSEGKFKMELQYESDNSRK